MNRLFLTARVIAATMTCGFWLLLTPSAAQEWPQRNVRFILPFGAGSATDLAARLLGERLSVRWGRPIVIDNRPGGDAIVAINAFVSAADDHVLLYASTASFLAHPYMQERLPYDLERDLKPIAQVADTVLVISVPASTDFKTITDFVHAARAAPEQYNVAGAPGLPQFAIEAFVKLRELKTATIPYRDIAAAARDIAEGRIQLLLSSAALVSSLVEAGKVRIIAVAAAQRSPLYTVVPTALELGFEELTVETTAGFYGPKEMSPKIRERIATDVIAAVNDPVVAAKIAVTGQDLRPGGPEELTKTLKQQAANTETVARVLGIVKK